VSVIIWRRGFDVEQERRSDGNVLIVERSIDEALTLQDGVVRDGGKVLTAYSLDRALLLARNAVLNDAIIDLEFDGVEEIVDVLKSRNVPFKFHAGQSPGDPTKLDARSSPPALKASSQNSGYQ
jgi:hypothetical protein